MRRYASSRFRVIFLAAMAAVLLASFTRSFAQSNAAPTTTPASGTAAHATKGPFALVLDNLDFVFVTIVVLSIIGVTLIIQGIIQNRRSVFLPDSTTNRIRELISANDFQELL